MPWSMQNTVGRNSKVFLILCMQIYLLAAPEIYLPAQLIQLPAAVGPAGSGGGGGRGGGKTFGLGPRTPKK